MGSTCCSRLLQLLGSRRAGIEGPYRAVGQRGRRPDDKGNGVQACTSEWLGASNPRNYVMKLLGIQNPFWILCVYVWRANPKIGVLSNPNSCDFITQRCMTFFLRDTEMYDLAIRTWVKRRFRAPTMLPQNNVLVQNLDIAIVERHCKQKWLAVDHKPIKKWLICE